MTTLVCVIRLGVYTNAGDSGGALYLDGSYTVSDLSLLQCHFLDNQAPEGPAVTQFETTEDATSRNVTFVGLTFTGNSVLCDESTFIRAITIVSSE